MHFPQGFVFVPLFVTIIQFSTVKSSSRFSTIEYIGHTAVNFTGFGLHIHASTDDTSGCIVLDRHLVQQMVSIDTLGKCLTLYTHEDCNDDPEFEEAEHKAFFGRYNNLNQFGWANKSSAIRFTSQCDLD
ncbi:uncharacterized protein LOC110849982 [Folsomia candida]|uniref:Uncharacterized protein n=1 Tax=Folsomia candida TaxID=158441 RepID=A0A226ECG1_FOLCA|nr:uncharacterized protein LOC110849982 [Folsomia candida]OXA55119.1 hypothetical protein Fcan01_10736 [Folsomia candida]